MIRPDRVLHRIAAAQWSRAEARQHLSVTFDLAAKRFPDLFEPYAIRLVDAEQDERTQMAIMREALRDTFATRHPGRFARQQVSQQQTRED